MESGEDGSSAPWERPSRWLGEQSGAEGVDPGSATGYDAAAGDGEPDAGARDAAGTADDADAPTGRIGRRRRYADEDDDTAIRASELIAALSGAGAAGVGSEAGAASGDAEAGDASGDAEAAGAAEAGADVSAAEAGAAAGDGDLGPDDGDTLTPGAGLHADQPHRGWLVTGRILVAALAVMLLLVAGTEWVIKARADAVLASNQISALDTDDTNISPTTAVPTTDAAGMTTTVAPAPEHYQAENILILGSDSRASAEDAALGGANKDPGGSDVVMVAHLSGDRSHVTVVSIPRDTYVEAPECKAWDYQNDELSDRDYTSPYSIWRINSTYAAGGAPCTVKAVQQMTGLRIDRVIVIDFAGFAAIVDAQGGIDVNACQPIVDGQLGTVLPVAGVQHIDGKQALNLVRARKVEGDSTSDIARIRRQQKVLSTILRQATSTGVLLNPIKLNNVLQAFVQNVKTDNVTLDNLLDIAQSLGNLDPRRVTFFTLPTVPDSNGVGLHATDGAALIWQALRDDTALPGEVTEPPTPTTTSAAPTTPMTTIPQDPVTSVVTSLVTTTPTAPQRVSVAPGDVDLQVVNVAGRPAVANQARDALLPLGFDIATNDMLRPDDDVRTGITVEYSSGNRAAALTVAAAVPGATLVEQSGLGSQVRLMLGSTFDGNAFAASVRRVAVGDALPSALSSAVTPMVSTVTSTVVSTPSPLTMPVPTTSTPPETTGPTLATSDVTSVNAGNASCI